MSSQTSSPQRVSVPPPRALPAAAWLGPLSALVLVALGVVLGQEALSRWDVVGTSWLGVALKDVDGMRAGTWTVPAGVVLVLLGLLLLVGDLQAPPPHPRPGRRRRRPVDVAHRAGRAGP